jgi:hypothetical protein
MYSPIAQQVRDDVGQTSGFKPARRGVYKNVLDRKGGNRIFLQGTARLDGSSRLR